MKEIRKLHSSRRAFLRAAGALSATAVLGLAPQPSRAADGMGKGLKIGIIGSGNVGGTLGTLWARAGHEVMFSSLDIEHDRKLAASVGHNAKAGTPQEAATFGEVLFFAVPYAALPGLGRDLATGMKGKIVIDASNPIPRRDGEMANAALAKGTGVSSPEFLPGTRLVRAYNEVGYARMRDDSNRPGALLGIPVAGDDTAAVKTALRLVRDAGHEPVLVGGLARAKDFDYGSAVFGKPLTAAELRAALEMKP